jgi:N-methylhydantoinase A/oxoprolinase/acetone carboxylase beta subunit
MAFGIGIDTGGTCTDAVLFDFDTRAVLAKGKALTTREDLSIGILAAIDKLPAELLPQAKVVALSTTLATNACVEGKGGRARLLLVGTPRKVLDWVDAKTRYGLIDSDVLCVDDRRMEKGDSLGSDWDALLSRYGDWLGSADALSVAETWSFENGSAYEKQAKELLESRFNVPVVMASELAGELNVLERGATALLNARLLPIIQSFMEAVQSALLARGIATPVMMVRSDGSLMADSLARLRPVETILSGPAASVLGGRALTDSKDCLIVDMGGTTTDISLIKDGMPVMSGSGIRIGGWRTQVKGVFMDTFALGGDSTLRIDGQRLVLMARRVQPLCVAAARWPHIKHGLKKLLREERVHSHPLHELLYLVRQPSDVSRYTERELALCRALEDGPLMLLEAAEKSGADIYSFNSERLEAEGIVMRCGLTPTDMMHIKGDYTAYDREASELAARYFMQRLRYDGDDEEYRQAFADRVYDMVRRRLYENIVRVLLTDKYPYLGEKGLDDQLRSLITRSWTERNERGRAPFFGIQMTTSAVLVGIGAPTHLFLPEVAQALGTRCIIPPHAAVANAVGAVVGDISASARVDISPNYSSLGIASFTVLAPDGPLVFETLEEAAAAAEEAAVRAASEEARRRGAKDRLNVKTQLTPHKAYANDGLEIELGASVTAFATDHLMPV